MLSRSLYQFDFFSISCFAIVHLIIFVHKKLLPSWRKHSQNVVSIINDLKQSKMGYDKITQFCLKPCGQNLIVDLVRNYFCWFVTDKENKIPGEK